MTVLDAQEHDDDMFLTVKQAERLSELTETPMNAWTNIDQKLGRMDTRGASSVAPRWNETNIHGQIVIPIRFHHAYPKKWKQFVIDSIHAISSYVKQCIVFVDDTSTQQHNSNYIEITCSHPETGAFNQGTISLNMFIN